jgi:hypothetical protein
MARSRNQSGSRSRVQSPTKQKSDQARDQVRKIVMRVIMVCLGAVLLYLALAYFWLKTWPFVEEQKPEQKPQATSEEMQPRVAESRTLHMNVGESKVLQVGTDGCPHCRAAVEDHKEDIAKGHCVYYDVLKVDVEKMLASYDELRAKVMHDLRNEPGIPKFYILRCDRPGHATVEQKILGYDKPKVDQAIAEVASKGEMSKAAL